MNKPLLNIAHSKIIRVLSSFSSAFRLQKANTHDLFENVNGTKMSPISSGQEQNGVHKTVVASSVLEIPQIVRGMTELQKDLFKTNINLSTLRVEASKISIIQRKVRLEQYLFKNLGRLKGILNGEDSKHKLLLFNPDLVNEQSKELREKIETMIKEYAGDVDMEWETRTFPITFEDWDLRRILKAVLPAELDLSSYSQAGHIVHVNLRENLLPYKKIIGQLLLEKVGKCRTVVNKVDGISNEYRNFELDLLAGDKDYVTEVIEDGIRYRLDFSKVFWNSRLSHEHERIVRMFDSKSLVYDACAGVGPFVLPAVKKSRIHCAMANDLNPESVRWLKENIALNKIAAERIDVYNLDAIDFIRGPIAKDLSQRITCNDAETEMPTGAHIMMNLPARAVNFLPALRGMLSVYSSAEKELQFPIKAYCYLFAKAHGEVPDRWYVERAEKMVRDFVSEEEASIDLIHHVRTVSSRKEMFCVQLNLDWKFLTKTCENAHKRGCEDIGSADVEIKRNKFD